MDWTDNRLLAVLPHVLAHLSRPDVLSLSRTNKALQTEVVAAWRHMAAGRQVKALVVASFSNTLLLLNALTGAVEQRTLVKQPGNAAGENGYFWPTNVDVDPVGQQCSVSQYEGPAIFQYGLPSLQLQQHYPSAQLAPEDAVVDEPEGIVFANNSLYVAWANGNACLTATPLEAVVAPPQQPNSASTAPAAADGGEPRQRTVHAVQLGADWVLWGAKLGPDGALYAACNPSYNFSEHYCSLPSERGRGSMVKVPLDKHGQVCGEPAEFCGGGLLSRPCGLCFDGAGDLYVTHLGCQVLKYQGPLREDPGAPIGVFIDTSSPELCAMLYIRRERPRGLRTSRCLQLERLSPDPQSLHPYPMEICWHEGIFYLTTHTCFASDNQGCLSLWDAQGQLLRAHRIEELHPNGLAVFGAAQ